MGGGAFGRNVVSLQSKYCENQNKNMNFFQKLFGGKTETPEEKKREDEARDFDVLKYDGVRALKSGQAAYAIKCFTHALALKDDLEIHDYLSQAYIHTGELPSAYEELRKLSEAQPDNQPILIRMANVAFMMDDYGAMASACEKALLIDKDKPEVSYLYAQASHGQGDDVNAIAMATRAITLNDKYGDAYLLRGTLRLDAEDVDGAAEDAAWLMEHAAEHEDVLLLSARIARKQEENEKAVATYGKVIEVNPFSAVAYRERAEVRRLLGDEEGAAADDASAEEFAPKGDADASPDIEQQTRRAYRDNPLGLG